MTGSIRVVVVVGSPWANVCAPVSRGRVVTSSEDKILPRLVWLEQFEA